LNAIPAAKDDQLWGERQELVERRLSKRLKTFGRPFLGPLNRAQKQGAGLAFSVYNHAFFAVALDGKAIAGIRMKFHAWEFLKKGQFCGQIIGFPKRQHPSEGF
jgi:hypothetical protein